jgi:hypothetical protein
MDPWLEDPEVFPDLHDSFIVYVREYLQGRLPSPYFATVNSHVWVDDPKRPVQPDANVLRPRAKDTAGTPAVAVAEPLATPLVVELPMEEERITFVEVRAGYRKERLVTTIEMLSLKNKSPGRRARELYRLRQKQVLAGQANLVEIDLLRGGRHATAVPHRNLRAAPDGYDYHACVSRFDDLAHVFIYPVLLRAPLPRIAVPLLTRDETVPLDLQAVLDRCYDSGPYQRQILYADRRPVPPLTPEQQSWAEGLLREKGLLPPA